MKKVLLGGALAFLVLLIAAPVWASNPGVCSGDKVDFEDLPATIDGVTITVVDDNTVHFDIPDGSTVEVCVKAGSIKQGNGPEYFTLTEDADLDHPSGKDISHVSVVSVTTPSETPSPSPSESETPSPSVGAGGTDKCEGHGQDRPKCQTATRSVATGPIAFTGPPMGLVVGLALTAFAFLLSGLYLLRRGARER